MAGIIVFVITSQLQTKLERGNDRSNLELYGIVKKSKVPRDLANELFILGGEYGVTTFSCFNAYCVDRYGIGYKKT